MIVRHGIDAVDIARFEVDFAEDPAGFSVRCFTGAELKLAEESNTMERLAGWFAVKEAVLKALGYGFSNDLAFNEIEVAHDDFGCPFISLIGNCARRASELSIKSWLVSISHTGSVAVASVIGLSVLQ
jgi:holo-[acyl-carrier protein] synthase